MLYQPDHVLLAALLLALALPEAGRWNPFGLAGYAARVFARDLPGSGRWAGLAGVLLLIVVVSPAVGLAWALVYALPVGLRTVAPDAASVVGLALAAILLRLTLWLPPAWVWIRWFRSQPPKPTRPSAAWRRFSICEPGGRMQSCPTSELLARCAIELAAPMLLYAFLGIYAAVAYRAALEVARALCDSLDAARLGAPAAWVTCIPAAPAHRLVILFSALAAPSQVGAMADACAETASEAPAPHQARGLALAAAATIALALLVTIW